MMVFVWLAYRAQKSEESKEKRYIFLRAAFEHYFSYVKSGKIGNAGMCVHRKDGFNGIETHAMHKELVVWDAIPCTSTR